MSFADEVEKSLPKGIRLPDEIRRALIWMEANNCVRVSPISRYGRLFPAAVDNEQANSYSCASLAPHQPDWFAAWIASDDQAVVNRVAVVAETARDGSQAGIWIDDTGAQKFVAMSSGGGWVGVIADNPIDFLRFLAIGYGEPGFAETFLDKTPEELHEAAEQASAELAKSFSDLAKSEPFRLPLEFRAWVEREFSVAIPAKGREIVTVADLMDADSSNDPFWQWTKKVAG